MKPHPLNQYRDKHKLTQAQLAELLGVSRATITHIETGKRRVTPEKAIEFEAKIGVKKKALCPEIFGGRVEQAESRTEAEVEARSLARSFLASMKSLTKTPARGSPGRAGRRTK